MQPAITILDKSDSEKLKYLSELNFRVEVKKKSGQFHLILPDLSLTASDENLNMAYDKLINKKESLFKKIIDYEFDDCLVKISNKSESKSDSHLEQIKLFTMKLAITFCFMLFVFGIGGVVAKRQLQNVQTNIKNQLQTGAQTALAKTKLGVKTEYNHLINTFKTQGENALMRHKNTIFQPITTLKEYMADVSDEVKVNRMENFRLLLSELKPYFYEIQKQLGDQFDAPEKPNGSLTPSTE